MIVAGVLSYHLLFTTIGVVYAAPPADGPARGKAMQSVGVRSADSSSSTSPGHLFNIHCMESGRYVTVTPRGTVHARGVSETSEY